MAGNERERGPDTPVKLSVVGPSKGNSGIWRRERIRMNEGELDDVAFLTGRKITMSSLLMQKIGKFKDFQ